MKRAAFLPHAGSPRRGSHFVVNFGISAAILVFCSFVGLAICFVGFALWHVSRPVFIGFVALIVIGIIAVMIFDVLRHKRKLEEMRLEAWLNAVRTRDVGDEIDRKNPVAEFFLREKFKAGCSPYEALAEWRRRKAEHNNRPRTTKPLI